MKKKFNIMDRAAFTLVELLVVIAIIALLAVLVMPAIGKARLSAHRVGSVGQLKQIGLALTRYGTDHDGRYPGPQGNTSDDDTTNDVIWAQRIAVLDDYLGPRTKWMHQLLTAPGIKYEQPGGGYYSYNRTYNTYAVTGAMCDILPSGWLDSFNGRMISMIENPSASPLVFLSRQRPNKGGHGHSLIKAKSHAYLLADLAAKQPEDTVVLNFDLGGSVPILMADGHVELVHFNDLNSFFERTFWEGR